MTERAPLPICANCAHWAMEPGALDEKHQKMLRDTTGIPGGTGIAYGKCNVAYTVTKSGQKFLVSLGTFGGQACGVTDEEGKAMFEPVPEG